MSAPTLAQNALADAIRRVLTDAARDYGQRTGIPSYRYLDAAPKSEINAVIARALAPVPEAIAQDAVDLAARVIREYQADEGMTMGLEEDARALLQKMEAGK